MTTNIQDGKINKTDVGKNISPTSFPADFILPQKNLDENTRKESLVKTRSAAKPRINPKMKFNSVLSTTGDKSEELAGTESEELSAPKVES